MKNSWTGGQYSLYRAFLGICLFIYFVALPPGIAAVATPLIVVAAVASIFFIIGLYDRIAALVVFTALVCLFARNPLIANPSVLFVGWLLIAHALLPPSPYGSLAARGRLDPRGGWSMPPRIFAASWIVLTLGWIWLAVRLTKFGLIVPIDVADLSFAMIMLHLFTFDPAWVPRFAPATTDRVLYDGTCGLCHRSVRFLIAEDRSGTSFVYAPQEGGGATIVVETAAGQTLTRSDAVIHLMRRLGGLWRALAFVFALVPRPLRDAGYDFVSRIRYRIFGRAKDACPLMPPDLRSRFTV